MSRQDSGASWQEVLYFALALVGLAGTWAQGLGFLKLGLVGGNVQFWKDAFGAPASAFLAVDILVLGAAVFVWLFGEARRLGMPAAWAWACLFGGLFVGISFAVPLFLAVRERRLRRLRPGEQATPAGADVAGIALMVAIAVAAAAYSLTHPY
jgi:hypothetical protein